jgi:hypothetical protein
MAHPSQAINSRAILAGDASAAAVTAVSAGVEHFFAIQNLHSAASTVTVASNYLGEDAATAVTSVTIPSGVTIYGKFTSVTGTNSQPILLYY